MPDISIVVPCYNEKDNISTTCEALINVMESINLKHEVIFVDNGGTDGQLETMKQLYEKTSRHRKSRFTISEFWISNVNFGRT